VAPNKTLSHNDCELLNKSISQFVTIGEEHLITGIRGLPHPLLLGNEYVNVRTDKSTDSGFRPPANGVSLNPSVPVGCPVPFLSADPLVAKRSDAHTGSSEPRPSTQPDPGMEAAAILDIPPPQSAEVQPSTVISPPPQLAETKRQLTPSSRRFYGRCLRGLQLPGRYYFITLTSTPKSPPITKSWNPLRQWLKYQRPGISWCYCFTKEGYGVIHMIVRLGPGEKRISAKELRAYWENLTGAYQIRIDHVEDTTKFDLASYIADQRSKRKLGGELAWQDGIVRWRWSKGWLPKGFTKAFGRVWQRLRYISSGEREKAVSGWLAACHADENNIFCGPGVDKNGEIRWPGRDIRFDVPNPAAVAFDDELKKIIAREFSEDMDETVRKNRFVSRMSSIGET